MTDEQIKKIAEEYARTQMDVLDQGYWDEKRLSDRAYNSILDAYTESVIPIVQFITERYCVVERSKVVEARKRRINYSQNSDTDCAACVSRMVNDIFNSLFGSETFNKKEDD